ncbi:ATP-binding protein [Streptomyces chartreusis]|uniref:ATP-binding protein n=1 Tax=Streptomyces chartreusis TaxID=1969 RepID=UPI00363D3819
MRTVTPPDTWAYGLRLPHDPRAARVARTTVRSVLASHGRVGIVDAVELLISEMVTNTYLHTDGPASLRLTALADGRLRVGVWDSHPRIPAPFERPPHDHVPIVPPDADGGRGLCLVQEYADCWGGVSLGDGGLDRRAGKLLWFEVSG